LSKAIRETLADVLTDYSNEDLRSDLKALTEYQRIKVITNLYRLLLPPVKQEVSEGNRDFEPFTIVIRDFSSKDDGNKN